MILVFGLGDLDQGLRDRGIRMALVDCIRLASTVELALLHEDLLFDSRLESEV